jgi:hypothetical protein
MPALSLGKFWVDVGIGAFRLQIIPTAGDVWRVNNTFRIVEDGRIHTYMQVCLSF